MSHRALYLGILASGIAVAPAFGQVRGPAIQWIAQSDLTDAAVAVADSVHPVVYYNPETLRQLGADMATFVRAHETAHIILRHAPSAFAHLPPGERTEAHRRAELAADCHAAHLLALDNRPALEAAISYFGSRGAARTSELHPTGNDRATALSGCLAQADCRLVFGPVDQDRGPEIQR